MNATPTADTDDRTTTTANTLSDLAPNDDAQPVKAAKAPRGTGPAPLVGQLAALALVGLGVVGVQEAVVRSNLSSNRSWTTATLEHLNDQGPPAWAIPAGIALIVIGLTFVVIAFKRRPRNTLPLTSRTGLHIRTHDLERLLDARLDGIDGATDTRVEISRRRVRITVTSIAAPENNAAIVSDTEERIGPTLAALEQTLRLKTKVRNVNFA